MIFFMKKVDIISCDQLQIHFFGKICEAIPDLSLLFHSVIVNLKVEVFLPVNIE